jgi:hypothetical protein
VSDPAALYAVVNIPAAWLNPHLTLDAVRTLQRGDTECELDRSSLRLRGMEVLVARNWIQDEYWPRIQDTIERGYAAEKTYTFFRANADRRANARPAS